MNAHNRHWEGTADAARRPSEPADDENAGCSGRHRFPRGWLHWWHPANVHAHEWLEFTNVKHIGTNRPWPDGHSGPDRAFADERVLTHDPARSPRG